MTNNKLTSNQGLTLIELLITIAVLALIAAIAVPVVTNVVAEATDQAVAQQTSDVREFLADYDKKGTVSYDDASQTFAGYVDLNGDGQVTSDEQVETLTVGSPFTVTYDGLLAVTNNDIAANYDASLTATEVDRWAVTRVNTVGEPVSTTAPTDDFPNASVQSNTFTEGSTAIGPYSTIFSPSSSYESATNDMVWQVFYAHADITIEQVGFSPYLGGSNTFKVYAAQAPTLTGFTGSPTSITSSWTQTYQAGEHYQRATSYTVAAGNYFVIGFVDGPYYKTIIDYNSKIEWTSTSTNEVMVTSVPLVYYHPHANNGFVELPAQLGGEADPDNRYTELNNSVAMYSLVVSSN